jgi:hypothetical protein
VPNRNWIKKDYTTKEVPGPFIFDTANIVSPYESTDVFHDEFLYAVQIQRQLSIYNRSRHLRPSFTLSSGGALWCHGWEFKMNLRPKG